MNFKELAEVSKALDKATGPLVVFVLSGKLAAMRESAFEISVCKDVSEIVGVYEPGGDVVGFLGDLISTLEVLQ